MHIPKTYFLSLIAALPLGAQTLKPVVTQALPDVAARADAPDTLVDLRTAFAIDGVTGTLVRFDTVFGLINVELFDEDTPVTVKNFLKYADQHSYDSSVIHRVETDFLIQGGGFKVPDPPTELPGGIPTLGEIINEAGHPNFRGTIAMARKDELDSASSQWYFNLTYNAGLDNPESPYAVFGRVIGNSMLVVDAIGRVQPFDMGIDSFRSFPLINPSGTLVDENYVRVNSVFRLPTYPTDGEAASALIFTVSNSNPDLLNVSVEDSQLRMSYQVGNAGSATITVTCVDSDGTRVSTSFDVEVSPDAPVITGQPVGRVVRIGNSLTLKVEVQSFGSRTYQWRRNGQVLSGETNQTLVLENANASDAGAYDVIVTDDAGSVTSIQAFVTVTDEMGFLTNLSTRSVTAVEGPFVWTTPGFVTQGSGSIEVLARAIGPGLNGFGVEGFLADPRISLAQLKEPKLEIKANDNWGSADNPAALAAATSAAGAFLLQIGSGDAALLAEISSDAYTANIFSQDGATGVVLGEVYVVGDPPVPGGSVLVNLSNRGHVGSGPEVMIGGLSIAGPGPVNLLVRGVGPTLAGFGVTGVLEDPLITVRGSGDLVVGSNDNWEDGNLGAALAGIAMSVGAFGLESGSADAMLLLVLNPGSYTVVLSGKDGGTGTGLVEFYLVP